MKGDKEPSLQRGIEGQEAAVETTMRTIVAGCLLAGLAGLGLIAANSTAIAQSTTGYPYCLLTGPDQECVFGSLAQCQAAKHGNADFCEPNNRFVARPYAQPPGFPAAGRYKPQ